MGDVPSNRPSWFPASLFPFTSRFLELPEGSIHYVDEGQGPVLLLLHGNPTWSFLYRQIIRELAGDFRCVALDYPGFGLSRAAAAYDFEPSSHARMVEEFIRRIDLREITIVAQDWGGPIGLWVAGRHPERVSGLILGNTWAWPVNGDPHFEWFSRLWGGAAGRALILGFNAFVNVLLPLGVRRRRLRRSVMEAYRAPFRRRESRIAMYVFPRAILAAREFLAEVEAGLSRLAHLPVLILWGDRDPAFRARERERFERLFPLHRTVLLRGSSHFIQEDAPDEVSSAIRTWYRISGNR